MITKTITWLTLACFVTTLAGCSHTEEIPREKLAVDRDLRITDVITYKGKHYVFRETPAAGTDMTDSTLVGTLESGMQIRIPLSEIQRVYTKKIDVALTIIAAIGIPVLVLGVVVLIAFLTKKSCPFVYSFDGEQYQFDGEPYGGAICDALERTDWCHLEHLKPVKGEYRLLLTNEVDETQYTDEFTLWAIDHRPGTDIVPDAEGKLYCVNTPLQLIRAADARGNDLTGWLKENDKLFWQSDLRTKDPSNISDRRDTILMEFPKPRGATRAKLIANGSTTMWGSQMLKRMTDLRGQDVPQWYESLKDPMNRMLLDAWGLREEIYKLQVKVGTDGAWVSRGILWGGGPYITETRVIPLDLQYIKGDTLRILLAPPAGFWQLNSFAIDYSEEPPPLYQEIAGRSMIGHDGADLRAVLSATDKQYYVSPETGQKANLTFQVPPQKPGTVRTLFAKVSGYYDLRARAEGPPQTALLARLSDEPGFSVSFALQEYTKWKSEMSSAELPAGKKTE